MKSGRGLPQSKTLARRVEAPVRKNKSSSSGFTCSDEERSLPKLDRFGLVKDWS